MRTDSCLIGVLHLSWHLWSGPVDPQMHSVPDALLSETDSKFQKMTPNFGEWDRQYELLPHPFNTFSIYNWPISA
jgi:hypothetical protein